MITLALLGCGAPSPADTVDTPGTDSDTATTAGCDATSDLSAMPKDDFQWLYATPEDGALPELKLDIPPSELAKLEAYDHALWQWYRGGRLGDKPKTSEFGVACASLTVEIDRDPTDGDPGAVFRFGSVDVVPKGMLFNSYQPIDGKPNLEVFVTRLDDIVTAGARPPDDDSSASKTSFKLYNQWEDIGQVARFAGYEMWNNAGYPAPRAGFAMVEINGRNVGLYGTNESTARNDFFTRHAPDFFTGAPDSIYEGDYGADFVPEHVEDLIDNADKSTDESDAALRDLADRAASSPTCDLDDAVGHDRLDVDRFLQFWALETLVGATEGYTYLTNNFNVAQDPTHGWILAPTGFDRVLVDAPLVCSPRGRLAAAMLEQPECVRRARETLQRMAHVDGDENNAWIFEAERERLDTLVPALAAYWDEEHDPDNAGALLPHREETAIVQEKIRRFLDAAPARLEATLAEPCLAE